MLRWSTMGSHEREDSDPKRKKLWDMCYHFGPAECSYVIGFPVLRLCVATPGHMHSQSARGAPQTKHFECDVSHETV